MTEFERPQFEQPKFKRPDDYTEDFLDLSEEGGLWKHLSDTTFNLKEWERLKVWLNTPVFKNAYKAKLHDFEQEAKKQAEYEDKDFNSVEGRSWIEFKALCYVTWHELFKIVFQKIASPFVSGLASMGKQLGGLDGKIKEIAEKFGIKIKDVTEDDVFIEFPDGTRKFNKNFFRNLGPHALLLFFVKDIPWMGVQAVMKSGGGMAVGMLLMSIPVVGYIPGCLLLMISSTSVVKSITVDFAKKLLQLAYHVMMHNFRGEGEAVIELHDKDGNLTEEGFNKFNECLNNPYYVPDSVPPECQGEINEVIKALDPTGTGTIDMSEVIKQNSTLVSPTIALPPIPGITSVDNNSTLPGHTPLIPPSPPSITVGKD